MLLQASSPHLTERERARKALAAARHFSALPEEIQNDLAAIAICRHYEPGQIIYMEGEPATHLYLLQSGWIKATRISPEGREQAMLFLKPGEVFGDVALFNEIPYPGTVTALEPVAAWALEREQIMALVRRHPELALAIIRRLSERVLHYIHLVEDLSLRSVEQRLAHNLLEHVEYQDGAFYVPRRSWATFDEMAVRLGTVRDVLSRALHTLEAEGLLRVERQRIAILNMEGLAARGV